MLNGYVQRKRTMGKRGTLTRSVLVMAMVGGAVGVTVTPAHAGGWADCNDGLVCMWEDPGAQGDEYVHWRPYGTGMKKNIGGWDGDNEISSIRNHSWYAIRVYDNDDYTGTSICVPSGTTVNKLGDSPWNFDNEAESLKTVSSC